MNWKIAAVIASTLLSISTTHAATLAVTETAESDAGLTSKLDGSDFGTITGAKDNWTLELPDGYSFRSAVIGTAFVGSQFIVAEPESASEVNIINITQPRFLTFRSDVSINEFIASEALFSNLLTIEEFVTGPNGSIDLVLADIESTQTPDGGATLALSGIALTALAGLRTRLRK